MSATNNVNDIVNNDNLKRKQQLAALAASRNGYHQ